jgi:hypothetical protein
VPLCGRPLGSDPIRGARICPLAHLHTRQSHSLTLHAGGPTSLQEQSAATATALQTTPAGTSLQVRRLCCGLSSAWPLLPLRLHCAADTAGDDIIKLHAWQDAGAPSQAQYIKLRKAHYHRLQKDKAEQDESRAALALLGAAEANSDSFFDPHGSILAEGGGNDETAALVGGGVGGGGGGSGGGGGGSQHSLDASEVSLGIAQLTLTAAQLSSLLEQNQNQTDTIGDLSKKNAERKAENQQLEAKLAEMLKSFAELQKMDAELRRKNAELETAVEHKAAKIAQLTEQMAQQECEIDKLNCRLDESKSDSRLQLEEDVEKTQEDMEKQRAYDEALENKNQALEGFVSMTRAHNAAQEQLMRAHMAEQEQQLATLTTADRVVTEALSFR